MKKTYRVKAVSMLFLPVIIWAYGCSKGGGSTLTTSAPTAPSISTSNVTGITTSSAVCGGTITKLGDNSATVISGICWDVNPQPTTKLHTIITNNAGLGTFNATLTGLTGGTTYYVRAYAKNSIGTTYGNQVSFTTSPSTIAIGQSYAGGIIFYVDNTKKHGLVMAPTDQATGITWDNGLYVSNSFTTSTAVGTGLANTLTIVSALGLSFTNSLGTYSGYAALYAFQYDINGYKDWYLPSKDEVTLMETNLAGVNLGTSKFTGGYWSSSTDATATYFAWQLTGLDNTFSLKMLSNLGTIRAIRAF